MEGSILMFLTDTLQMPKYKFMYALLQSLKCILITFNCPYKEPYSNYRQKI